MIKISMKMIYRLISMSNILAPLSTYGKTFTYKLSKV